MPITRQKIAKGLRITATYIEIDYVQYAKWLLDSAKKTWVDAKVICKKEFNSYKHMGDHAFELRDIESKFMQSPDAGQILKDRTWNIKN